jgi:hypothetical protein
MSLAFHSAWVCTALKWLHLGLLNDFHVLLLPPLDVCLREILFSCCFKIVYLSYMFNHLNLKFCILTAPVTWWYIPFHISTSFLNTICHFKVRGTWVSTEPHDVYYFFYFIASLAFCATLWQDVDSDLEIYFLSPVSGFIYS